jgi:hypothetical protein
MIFRNGVALKENTFILSAKMVNGFRLINVDKVFFPQIAE